MNTQDTGDLESFFASSRQNVAYIELAQPAVTALLIVFAALIFGGLGLLILRSGEVRDMDARLSSLNEEVELAQKRLSWSREYARILGALHEVAGKNLGADQKIRLVETLWVMSRNYRFDPLIAVAVMQVESRANPWARGKFASGEESGALGLMQLKLSTARLMSRDLGFDVRSETDLIKPEVNLLLGTYYLMRLVVRTGNMHRALMAYNIGPAALEQALLGNAPMPSGYVRKVLAEYSRLCEIYGPMPG